MPTKLIVAAMLTGAASSAAPPAQMGQPGYEAPAQPWSDIEKPGQEVECRDRINRVRAAAGKPELDRAPATDEKPELLYAVDRRVDGCGVLVPVNDPAAVREIPPPGEPRFRRLEPHG